MNGDRGMMNVRQTPSLFSLQRSAGSIRQGGFSLVEGMVALIVLSIGLFGIAGMLDMAISRNTDASQVSVATNMGTEMMERIRFNHYNVAAYDLIDTTNLSTRPPATQAMAMGDYDQWRARLNATNLQNIRGLVTVGTTGPILMNQSQAVVQVSWRGGLRTQTLLVSTIFAPE
ncbi:MAG: type IV pilus modification protein PilV [Nitrospira sp.]|nr:MAG: type IV pilus modification protein PilV [Nitrospira sp.]